MFILKGVRKQMPRDKTLSHIKVNKAIKEEFLEKGFENASIRSIGARASRAELISACFGDNIKTTKGEFINGQI